MAYVSQSLQREVWSRAADRCEYCQLPSRETIQVFEIEHVIALKHNGATQSENLCLSCLPCNRHKGTDVAGFDPATGLLTRLFHPRSDRWPDHFIIHDGAISGLTDVGRTTVHLLQMNPPAMIELRRFLVRVDAW